VAPPTPRTHRGESVRVPIRVATAGFGLAASAILLASGAWACVPSGGGSGRQLTVSPTRAQPGDQVTVSAPSAAAASPVEIRLNAGDGPVLGTLVAGSAPASAASVYATFTLPLDTKPGQNALIAVQPGQRWEHAALAVALPDGTVPEARNYETEVASQSREGGRRTTMLAMVGVAVLGLSAMAVRSRVISRPGRVTRSTRPTTSPGPRTDATADRS
jgi:hypothetical protein